METSIDDKILVASSLKRFIDNDKNVSRRIVDLLQYANQEMPDDFYVTDLKIKNSNFTVVDFPLDLNSSKINVDVEGFFEENSEKSLKKIKKLMESLENTGNFKNVSFIQGKGLEKSRTHFLIKLAY